MRTRATEAIGTVEIGFGASDPTSWVLIGAKRDRDRGDNGLICAVERAIHKTQEEGISTQ